MAKFEAFRRKKNPNRSNPLTLFSASYEWKFYNSWKFVNVYIRNTPTKTILLVTAFIKTQCNPGSNNTDIGSQIRKAIGTDNVNSESVFFEKFSSKAILILLIDSCFLGGLLFNNLPAFSFT